MSMQLTIFEHSITEKRCAQCKEVKLIVNFNKNKAKKDGFNFYCTQCCKVYYENNKKVFLLRQKVFYENNKEVILQHRKNYREKNKEKLRQNDKIYINKRLQSDPLYRIMRNLRSRVGKFCKSVSMQKNWKTLDAMCCTREEFIAYFEPLFTEGMTWENYGAWHVDHIKPISLATTEQEAIQLSHYTNLQPLWAEDNLSKGNKYD